MSVETPFQSVEWKETMATGIGSIDKQHRYLVDTLRLANEKLLCGDDDALLVEIVKEMLGYAITHFETEEGLMQRYDYAAACPEEANDHISQHREFSRQVVAVYDQLQEGRHVSRQEVLMFLNNWLQDHLLGIDQLLGRFLVQAMGGLKRADSTVDTHRR